MQKTILLLSLLLLPFTAFAQTDYKTPQELADPDGHFTNVNGASIYYIARGDAKNPAVILIHGFGGSTFTWRDNMDAIAEAGYYVVALDLPPFGLSDKSAEIGYTHRDFADYVVGLMDELNIETATIVGHSMGGSVAAHVAIQYPDRVHTLIFVDGGIFDMAQTDTDERDSPFAFLSALDPKAPAAANLLRALLTPQRFFEIISSAYYDSALATDEVLAGYTRPLLLEDWAIGFLSFLQAREANTITLDNLVENAHDIPTLIIWGAEDTWVPITMGETMHAVLPLSAMLVLPQVGHLPMEESVETFNLAVIEFLNEHGS